MGWIEGQVTIVIGVSSGMGRASALAVVGGGVAVAARRQGKRDPRR